MQRPTDQNRSDFNIYSETPPNRKLVRSKVFRTQLSDENANVIPPTQNGAKKSTKGADKRKKPTRKPPYDRIKLGKFRWKFPNRKNPSYEDINDFSRDKPAATQSDVATHNEATRPQAQQSSNYENPSTFVLQSYVNVAMDQQAPRGPTFAVDETVMQENTGVYESVETTA